MGRGLDGYFCDARRSWRCAALRDRRRLVSSPSGGYGEGETPLPIPNREVKPLSADGTWLARARESRSPPVPHDESEPRASGARVAREAAMSEQDESAEELIEARIAELGDWRGATLARLRALIRRADPEVVEQWKWRKATSPGVPVWYHGGPICTGETYRSVVKLTFFRGASLPDPAGLFNS